MTWHRWNGKSWQEPGRGLPEVGDFVVGPRVWWKVLEIRPVESQIHPNAWRARMTRGVPHHGRQPAIEPQGRLYRVWHYPGAPR